MSQNDLIEKESQSLLDMEDRICFQPVLVDADAVYEKIWHKIRNENIVSMGVSPVWKYISIAASLALLVVSAALVSTNSRKVPLASLEVSAVSGTRVKVVLPDSTIVWLNSNAIMRYPPCFEDDTRSVELVGEALFEVAHDINKPFIVNTEGLRILVLGTKFNVFSLPDTDVIETTLLEGSIALFRPDNQTSEADIVLSPDQQALYDKTNGGISVLNVRASTFASWMSGNFVFERKTLQEIATSLERAFSVRIHIQSEKLRDIRLTASFVHQETLDEILSILQVSAKYKYERRNNDIYIRDK